MRFLNIGGPVALAVVGAVLFFAVNVDFSGIEVSTIGLILMVAAAVWFVVGLVVAASLKSKEETVVEQPVVNTQRRTTIDER